MPWNPLCTKNGTTTKNVALNVRVTEPGKLWINFNFEKCIHTCGNV